MKEREKQDIRKSCVFLQGNLRELENVVKEAESEDEREDEGGSEGTGVSSNPSSLAEGNDLTYLLLSCYHRRWCSLKRASKTHRE